MPMGATARAAAAVDPAPTSRRRSGVPRAVVAMTMIAMTIVAGAMTASAMTGSAMTESAMTGSATAVAGRGAVAIAEIGMSATTETDARRAAGVVAVVVDTPPRSSRTS